MSQITKDTINEIRQEIADLIETESVTSEIFAVVYAYPKSTIQDFPAVIVMPSENESDYAATDSRKMTFAFDLNIFYPTNKEIEAEKTELAVGEAVGEILRIFTARNPLTNCDWVIPVPSIWGEVTVGEATFRTATVNLQCIKYVEI
jgi:hypothetical protein